MRRLSRVLTSAVALGVGLVAAPGPAPAAAPPRFETRVFAKVPAPGHPAFVLAHRNGRVYAGTYTDPAGGADPSKVFEYSPSGKPLRSWTVPGQRLDVDHGVQVANQTRGGALVVLETSTASILTLNIRNGHWNRVARLPAGSVPNYATWGPHAALFVDDFAHGVIYKIPRRSHQPRRWFSSPALQGVEFGTTGLVFRPGRRDLLIDQQTSSDGAASPTNGHLYRLPIRAKGRPGRLETLWTSRPGDLPDGIGVARSGHVYVALAGSSNQLVELSSQGREVARFPDLPVAGTNSSPVPFDTPCSATFLGTRILVANQSAVEDDDSHQAILSVEVGERGRPTYLPRGAHF